MQYSYVMGRIITCNDEVDCDAVEKLGNDKMVLYKKSFPYAQIPNAVHKTDSHVAGKMRKFGNRGLKQRTDGK